MTADTRVGDADLARGDNTAAAKEADLAIASDPSDSISLLAAMIAAVTYHLVLWPRDPKRGIDAPAVDVPVTQQPR